ncbi:MAG: OsmC family protein, partial [Chloroflexi bacterium]|nr:OsmC family protein [Chloroflexota bacterium]
MYARRKQWPLEGVEVGLTTFKEHAADCENCEHDPDARIDVIEREILFHGDLAEEQIQRLLEIADKCPVHRTMTGKIQVRTTVARE